MHGQGAGGAAFREGSSLLSVLSPFCPLCAALLESLMKTSVLSEGAPP